MSFGLGGKVHIICKMNAKIPLTPVVFLDGKEAGGQSAHKHIFLGGGGVVSALFVFLGKSVKILNF